MARRCSQRMRTHACAKAKVERGQQAGGNIMPLASRRAKVQQDSADWLAGFGIGLTGCLYVHPVGVRDQLAWTSGYIEGKAQRGHS
jgi:hypothetical protein